MNGSAPWPLPPIVQRHDFLPPDEHRRLLDWVLANEASFTPATIVRQNAEAEDSVKPDFRVALTTHDLGANADFLERRMRAIAPVLAESLGTNIPAVPSIELELAAHGDGAYYKTHLDIPVGAGRKPTGARRGEDRLLSAVYYFHSEPKSFSGGALRVYRFNIGPGATSDDTADFRDVEPIQNSLVAFPSWAPHEVRPIRCPGGTFRDYRFALNCWFCGKLESEQA